MQKETMYHTLYFDIETIALPVERREFMRPSADTVKLGNIKDPEKIKSKIADIKNTSNTRGAGGTLTGGEFLRQFVGETHWAHLDIAGTAFVENDSRLYYGHGATGYGVRLLVHFILNH